MQPLVLHAQSATLGTIDGGMLEAAQPRDVAGLILTVSAFGYLGPALLDMVGVDGFGQERGERGGWRLELVRDWVGLGWRTA